MRTELDFAGWFQIRLATNPDPHDEPRGVTGYTWSLPGEPDLDRIVRFQPEEAFVRVGCAPEVRVGVTVHGVRIGGVPVENHPLVGAPVDLLDDPVFEGRNGVIADNGVEPIVPFRLRVGDPPRGFTRGHADVYTFPYRELRAQGMDWSDESKADVRRATGIDDLGAVWAQRRVRLAELAKQTDDPALAEACRWRVAFMETNADLTGDFGIRMKYHHELRGAIEGDLPGTDLATEQWRAPWSVTYWMGGWDFDSMCALVTGTLAIGAGSGTASDQ